jgi:hypothetical protein
MIDDAKLRWLLGIVGNGGVTSDMAVELIEELIKARTQNKRLQTTINRMQVKANARLPHNLGDK